MKLLLFFLAISITAYSQVKVKGNVADAGSGRCIPYATIGLPGKHNGTLAAENGSFEFLIDNNQAKEKVLISAAGYRSKLVTADSLKSNKVTVALTPIKDQTSKSTRTGRKLLAGNLVDRHDQKRPVMISTPGSEESALIRNQDTLNLTSFHLMVGTMNFDTLLLRVNIYSSENGRPSNKLNKEDHFFALTPVTDEIIKVVLDEEIRITGDIFASLEFVRSDGNGTFSIYSFEDPNEKVFIRKAAQGGWNTEKIAAPGFWFETVK